MRLIVEKEDRITNEQVKKVLKGLTQGESKSKVIRELFAGGLSVSEISDVTTIRYNYVYNVCKNEVIKFNLGDSVTTAREGGTKKEKIQSLLEEGKTIAEVSRELGCLYNQVWQVSKSLGLNNKNKKIVEVK